MIIETTPSVKRINVKKINSDIPITISGAIIGIWSMESKTRLPAKLNRVIANAAIVPIIVETNVDAKATIRLIFRAFSMEVSASSFLYQSSVKPAQTTFILALLKEKITSINMGRYRKI